VEESRLGTIRAGSRVEVSIDSIAKPLNGSVSEIVPAVDPASRSGIVKIDLPAASGTRSGLFGRANFAYGERIVIAAPERAISRRGQMSWVFVAQSGRARARIVTLGDRHEDQIEILSGVAPNETLIAPVPPALTDGAQIEVRR
jgi:multidrug efflux pump subunit AcrA (membrane-fusion protein)